MTRSAFVAFSLIIAWVTAYVDESVRLEGDGWYVLAAVVVPDGQAEAVREVLRASLRRGQRRYHWYEERPRGRAQMAATIAALDVMCLAVAATPVTHDRQTRARRRCFTRLLWELGERGVDDVVIESRKHEDARDRNIIAYLHRAGWVPADLRCEFARPDHEPLLWLADVVAGATARAAADGDRTYLDALGDVTVVIAP